MKGISKLLLVTFVVLISRVDEGMGNVQFVWYPVKVAFSGTPATFLRRTPGQSVHFQVRNTQDGSYHFGYDADTVRDKSYREERRDAFGRVTGSYGYVDPDGTLRVVEYVADEQGYRARTTNHNQVYMEPSENIQVIGPIPKPFSEFFNL